MVRRLTKKEIKKDEFMEVATDAGEWLENNWRQVLGWAGGLAVLALVFAGWHFYGESREAKAQALLGQGIEAFRAASDPMTGTVDDYQRAADLFLEAADKSGSVETEKVADLYRGISLARSGRGDEAIPLLEETAGSGAGLVVTQTAEAALADLYERLDRFEEAEKIYLQLAAEENGVYPPAQALLNAGLDRKAMGRDEEAKKLFEGILQDYPQTAAAAQVRKMSGMGN